MAQGETLMEDILVPVSPGELIDKITILRLKADKMSDQGKLKNVQHELAVLSAIVDRTVPASAELTALWEEMQAINAALWVIEDDIRDHDAAGDFGATFVALARAVYQTNDRRAAVKKKINLLLGSAIVEEKSYHDHSAGAV
jgi:hypothetical protein